MKGDPRRRIILRDLAVPRAGRSSINIGGPKTDQQRRDLRDRPKRLGTGEPAIIMSEVGNQRKDRFSRPFDEDGKVQIGHTFTFLQRMSQVASTTDQRTRRVDPALLRLALAGLPLPPAVRTVAYLPVRCAEKFREASAQFQSASSSPTTAISCSPETNNQVAGNVTLSENSLLEDEE